MSIKIHLTVTRELKDRIEALAKSAGHDNITETIAGMMTVSASLDDLVSPQVELLRIVR